MVRTKSGLTWYGPDQIRSNSARWPDKPEKKLLFRVLVSFLSCFLLFHQQYVYEMPFMQTKNPINLVFSSRRNANCDCPPRIGGHHFVLCQHTNTEDIAGQSAKPNLHNTQYTYMFTIIIGELFDLKTLTFFRTPNGSISGCNRWKLWS